MIACHPGTLNSHGLGTTEARESAIHKGPSFHVPQIKDGFKMIQISNIHPLLLLLLFVNYILIQPSIYLPFNGPFCTTGMPGCPQVLRDVSTACHCPCPLQSRASHRGYASIPDDPGASVPHEKRGRWNPQKNFKTIISQTRFRSFSLEL